MFIIIILSFVIIGSWMEAKKLRFGHETTVVILMGMFVSFLGWVSTADHQERFVIKFNQNIFFEYMLPAILYSTGFNMRRKELFDNFANITKFGIFGSLFTFFLYAVLTKILFISVPVNMY